MQVPYANTRAPSSTVSGTGITDDSFSAQFQLDYACFEELLKIRLSAKSMQIRRLAPFPIAFNQALHLHRSRGTLIDYPSLLIRCAAKQQGWCPLNIAKGKFAEVVSKGPIQSCSSLRRLLSSVLPDRVLAFQRVSSRPCVHPARERRPFPTERKRNRIVPSKISRKQITINKRLQLWHSEGSSVYMAWAVRERYSHRTTTCMIPHTTKTNTHQIMKAQLGKLCRPRQPRHINPTPPIKA